MINDLDLLYKPIASKRSSIPDDMSGDPQNDALDDNLCFYYDYHHDF